MSTPLKDFRLGISEAAHAALEAEAIAFDRPMESIARDLIHEWAARKHRAYTVYARRVLANGMQPELPGFEQEDAGTSRKGRR